MECFALKSVDQISNQFNLDRNITEIIRGIAISFVVLGHILGGVFDITTTHITMLLGTGGVNMFLFLSGYGSFRSYRLNGMVMKPFWSKKITKIFMPYGMITLIYYIYLILVHKSPGRIYLLKNILCIDFTRAIDGTMWYMSYILIWYLVFFIVFYFDYNMLYKLGLLGLIGSNFSAYWLNNLFQDCSYQFSINAYSFPVGVLVAYVMDCLNFNLEVRKCVKKVIEYVILGCSVIIFVLGNMKIITVSYWEYGICEFIIIYKTVAFFLYKINLSLAMLKWIGKNSFFIYLIEAKLISIVSNFDVAQHNIVVFSFIYLCFMIIAIYIYSCFKKKAAHFSMVLQK